MPEQQWHMQLYIKSDASSHLVFTFIAVPVIHLVMQETAILQNRQNTNNRASGIIKVISKN